MTLSPSFKATQLRHGPWHHIHCLDIGRQPAHCVTANDLGGKDGDILSCKPFLRIRIGSYWLLDMRCAAALLLSSWSSWDRHALWVRQWGYLPAQYDGCCYHRHVHYFEKNAEFLAGAKWLTGAGRSVSFYEIWNTNINRLSNFVLFWHKDSFKALNFEPISRSINLSLPECVQIGYEASYSMGTGNSFSGSGVVTWNWPLAFISYRD